MLRYPTRLARTMPCHVRKSSTKETAEYLAAASLRSHLLFDAMGDGRWSDLPIQQATPESGAKAEDPEGAGYKDDLYAVDGAPPEVRSYIEDHFLLRTDQLAHDALQWLLCDRLGMPGDLRSGWTRFIMSMLQRTPEKITWLLEHWYKDFDAKIGIDDPIRKAVTTIGMLQKVMDLPQTGEKINGMLWNVVSYSNVRFPVLTSDRPVIISNGLLRDDSHVIVPIGPERLFVAGNSETFVASLKSLDPEELIFRCNETIVLQSHTYVYGRDDQQLRFIENRLGRSKPQLITRDINPQVVPSKAPFASPR
jgi:Protein of unknown function (DUF4238)